MNRPIDRLLSLVRLLLKEFNDVADTHWSSLISSSWPGVELASCWSQVQCPNHYTAKPCCMCLQYIHVVHIARSINQQWSLETQILWKHYNLKKIASLWLYFAHCSVQSLPTHSIVSCCLWHFLWYCDTVIHLDLDDTGIIMSDIMILTELSQVSPSTTWMFA